MTRALVVVDVPKDFHEGASDRVGGGAERARAIAELIQGPARESWTRVAGLVAGSDGGEFPDASAGAFPGGLPDAFPAAVAAAVEAGAVDEVFFKDAPCASQGASPGGFGGFSEDGTPLADWLHDRGVDAVDIVGTGVDHCVKTTALGAVRAGFATRVLLDYTAGAARESTLAAISELGDAGVELTGTPVVAAAV